ncbi:MAG TPA: DEAD/DEAH box helicase [Xanthobacteraceae bacterium]|nr:DEAD/DEAH box helicase [Xanthobacteraceae bacterium]
MRPASDLRDYQQRIATHLYEQNEAMCVLRPGGGKTIAALTAIADLIDQGEIRHALIIAPKRVARVVWPDEIAQWAHTAGLTYAVLDGMPQQRQKLLRHAPDRDLTIIGLDVVQWLLEELTAYHTDHALYDLLVIDEASRLRNPTGERAKALAKYAHHWRMVWGLSGTLRPSGPLDLFMPARVVTRGKLWGRSYWQWRKEHFYPTDQYGYEWKPLPGAEEKLNAELAPLTVTVAEGEMPTVTPTIVLDRVELLAKARLQYREMQTRLLAELEDDDVIASSMAVATGKLAQMANGFVYGAGGSHDVNDVHSAKREWLKDLIAEASEPTLIVYEYRADLAMLEHEVHAATGKQLRYLGAGVTDKQAAATIEDWNAGKLRFMGLHPASGGHGLNLQHGGADMAWICPTWSPEMWEQTIARLARPGQQRPVVVRVCVASNTVDEMKLDRVHFKMDAQEAFEAWLRRWHACDRTAPACPAA